jgi:hypothetical protein
MHIHCLDAGNKVCEKADRHGGACFLTNSGNGDNETFDNNCTHAGGQTDMQTVSWAPTDNARHRSSAWPFSIIKLSNQRNKGVQISKFVLNLE